MKVFVCYRQTSLFVWQTVKVFSTEEKAKAFCDAENDNNQPEFDSYGYCEGIYHNFFEMEVE